MILLYVESTHLAICDQNPVNKKYRFSPHAHTKHKRALLRFLTRLSLVLGVSNVLQILSREMPGDGVTRKK